MLMPIKGQQDLASGLFFTACGATGLWVSREYPLGSAFLMGTGFMPRLLCGLLIILGVAIALRSLVRNGSPGGRIRWRPPVAVVGSIVAFGLLVESIGLVLAAALVVVVSSLADATARPWPVAATVLGVTALVALVFGQVLSVPLPLWPGSLFG